MLTANKFRLLLICEGVFTRHVARMTQLLSISKA